MRTSPFTTLKTRGEGLGEKLQHIQRKLRKRSSNSGQNHCVKKKNFAWMPHLRPHAERNFAAQFGRTTFTAIKKEVQQEDIYVAQMLCGSPITVFVFFVFSIRQ